jgi:hypothetical protein
MRIGSLAQWADEQGISRQAAYKRLREHGVPFLDPATHGRGKLDLDHATAVWEASMNPKKQAAGAAGGEGRPPESQQTFTFPADPGERSMMGKVQLRREITRAQKEEVLLKRLQGTFVDIAAVRKFESDVLAELREQLTVIGQELGDELAQESDAYRCRQLVEERINRALRQVATYKQPNQVTA